MKKIYRIDNVVQADPEHIYNPEISSGFNNLKRGIIGKVVSLLSKYALKDLLKEIFDRHNIPTSMHEEAEEDIHTLLTSFQERAAKESLRDRPVRDYRRGEGIIAYLTNEDEGLGKWLKAGALSRPEIRKIAPRAYDAIAHLLRTDEGKAEFAKLKIPKRAEITDAALAIPSEETKKAMRAKRAIEKRKERQAHKPTIETQ